MGVPLYSRTFDGPTAQPPIVILHGLLGSSRNWHTIAATLAGLRTVHALDLRNHGRSPHAASHTFAEMEEDVLAWLDGRNLPRATLLGHSLGAKTAMRMACRHPDRISQLILVDAAPKDQPPRWEEVFGALRRLQPATLASRGQAGELLAAEVPDWAFRQFLLSNLEPNPDGPGFRWLANLPVLAGALFGLYANPLAPGDFYPGPTLVLRGARSDFLTNSDRPRFDLHFPQHRWVEVSAAGHNVHFDNPTAFVEACHGFLAPEGQPSS